MTTLTLTDTPRIYVASLADYNAGHLHGVWIDCDQDVEDIQLEIKEMLSESQEHIAEDWAIHDVENFGGLSLKGYDLDQIAEIGQAIEEHGNAVVGYIDNMGEWDESAFQDAYMGEWESEASYAENLAYDTGDLRRCGDLACYIDFDMYARDLFSSGYWSWKSNDATVHVYANY